MNRRRGPSWLAIAALVISGCVTTTNERTSTLRTGVTAEVKGEYDQAIETYTAALEGSRLSEQDRALFQIRRAHAYISKGEVDKAIADTDEVIRLKPDMEAGYTTRALAYMRKQQYELAIADLDVSARLAPSANVYHTRGSAFAANTQYDQAVADYDQALRLAPRYAQAYLSRANLYLQRGDYERALGDLAQSIGIQPDNAEAYNSRGGVFSRMGQFEKAYQEYGTALLFQPKVATIYSNRGHIAAALGRYDAAAVDLAQSIALLPREARNGYDVIWLHLFRLKAKQDGGTEELSRNVATLVQQPWPQAIASVYLGKTPPEQLRKMAEQMSGEAYPLFMCQATFHAGYYHLLRGDTAIAKPAMQEAAKSCPAASAEQRVATSELKAVR